MLRWFEESLADMRGDDSPDVGIIVSTQLTGRQSASGSSSTIWLSRSGDVMKSIEVGRTEILGILRVSISGLRVVGAWMRWLESVGIRRDLSEVGRMRIR